MLAGEVNRVNDGQYISQLLPYFFFDGLNPNCPLGYWARSSLRRKIEPMCDFRLRRLFQNYLRSRGRAFLLSCIFGFGEILHMDQHHEPDDNVKERCILAATV